MTDVFKFSSKSADAAPGKGAGETLVSPPETYAELRKIVGWRRLLASGDTTPLVLTKQAELWEGKKRRTDLEEQRAMLQAQGTTSKLEETMEAPPAPPKKLTAKELFAQLAAKKAAAPAAAVEESATGASGEAAPPEVKTKPKSKAKAKAAGGEAAAPAPIAEETKAKKPRGKSKKVSEVPEGVVTEGAASAGAVEEPSYTLAPPDTEEQEHNTSTIRFCPICRYYLYLQVNNPEPEDPSKRSLYRLCRNCGFKEEDEKGGLLSEIIVGERSAEGYKILFNEHTKFDPNLPHLRGVMKCPDPACESNHGKESDIIYMKYDSVNLLYMYICNLCGYRWRSRR